MYNNGFFSGTNFLVLSMLLSIARTGVSASSKDPLTDASIIQAVALWLENPKEAENDFGPIELWDTSEVTNLDNLFLNQAQFNEDLSQWDVSKVTSMKKTFAACTHFNSPLNDWNVSSVTSMSGMLNGAASFNQDLHLWDTSKVIDLSYTFKGANMFNGLLQGWQTGNVKNMELMFYGATFFEDDNNSLQSWDVSSVTSMVGMFSSATRFHGDLSLWRPKKVVSFKGMFAYAVSFDSANLNGWDVSSAEFMDRMFYRAASFEAELCWDSLGPGVSGVEMLCGSSGTFGPDCSNNNVPLESEDCPEAYAEMEEEYEVRESQSKLQDPGNENESKKPTRGGSGAVGAMNPGATSNGQYIPEVAARGEDAAITNTDINDIPPQSEYNFELAPIFDAKDRASGQDGNSESIFNSIVEADSSGRRRKGASNFLLVSIAATFTGHYLL